MTAEAIWNLAGYVILGGVGFGTVAVVALTVSEIVERHRMSKRLRS